MQFKKQFLYLPLLVIFASVLLIEVAAQQEVDVSCGVDIKTLMKEVHNICTGIGENQVCYGKEEVNALPRDEKASLQFKEPGDNANLSQIQSLFLSKLDPKAQTWGIAQMRLLAATSEKPADITLLFFGNVSIENATQTREVIEVKVDGPAAANIRNAPSLEAFVAGTADPGATLRAVGRLQDNSWLRVEDNKGLVGWVTATLVSPVSEGASFDLLTAEQPRSRYYGNMQAFYFESNASNTCGSMVSDGLLIQTPDGLARVTLLINEVSVELLGTNESEGVTALVQSNKETGLTLDMLNGSANVTVENKTVEVKNNMSVSVPMTEDRKAAGEPSEPAPIAAEKVDNIVLLPLAQEAKPTATNTAVAGSTATGTNASTLTATTTASQTITGTATLSTEATSVTTTEEPAATEMVTATSEIFDTPVPDTPTTEVLPTATDAPPTESQETPTDENPTTEPPLPTDDTATTDVTETTPTETAALSTEAMPSEPTSDV